MLIKYFLLNKIIIFLKLRLKCFIKKMGVTLRYTKTQSNLNSINSKINEFIKNFHTFIGANKSFLMKKNPVRPNFKTELVENFKT